MMFEYFKIDFKHAYSVKNNNLDRVNMCIFKYMKMLLKYSRECSKAPNHGVNFTSNQVDVISKFTKKINKSSALCGYKIMSSIDNSTSSLCATFKLQAYSP